MEKALIKMARQLCAYDEASLMSLWEKYAAVVKDFEPSRRWEEAAIALGLIQTLRWKNQLFNFRWAEASAPDPAASLDESFPTPRREPKPEPAMAEAPADGGEFPEAAPEPRPARTAKTGSKAGRSAEAQPEAAIARKAKLLQFPPKKTGE